MALDIPAQFKITAGVVGQSAVDALNKSVAGLNTQVTKIPGLAKTAGLAMAGLGAGLAVSTFTAKFDGVVESILAVKDAAEKTGSTVEKMGGLVQAAKITGDDWGTIEGAIIKMDKALAGADDTAKGAAHALDFIGLSISDLRKMDPADAFTAISKAMAGVKDGAGKTAIAMDIFGKNGAQVLPFMKDYAELGEQISKVTQQQADDAETYDRAVRKLNASKQDLYKLISTQLLPVATDFLQALQDVTSGTNGVKDAAKGLASDGSMKSAFREGAMAGAAFLDVMSAIVSGLVQVGSSARVVYHDIAVAVAAANFLNPIQMGKQLVTGGNQIEDFKKILAERNAVVEQANKDMETRWSGSMTPYTDALRKKFETRDMGAGAGRGSADDPRRTDAPKDSTTYKSTTPKLPGGSGGGGADPYTTELQSMGREAAKLQWQTEHIQQFAEKITSAKEAQVQFDIEQGKFKDLSQAQKDALLAAARAVDTNAESLRQAQVGLEFEKQTKAIDTNTESLGLNTTQRELAAAAQDLENKGIKEGSDLYEKLMASRTAALQRRDDAMANPFNGIGQGIAAIGDQVKDQAGQMKDALVSAFDGAADALANFAMTGKLNFKDFAKSVISDLLKMIIKQQLFNILAGLSGSFGGGGAATASAGTGTAAVMAAKGLAVDGVHAFANGGTFTNSIVSSPTLFKFANGGAMKTGVMGEAGPEAIMPLVRGSNGKLGVSASGGGASVTNNTTIGVTVNASTGSSSTSSSGANTENMRQVGEMIAAKTREIIIKEQRPGGLLAA